MTNSEATIASKKPVHWTVLHNYRLRAGSFVTALIVIATHVWDKGYGPMLWILLALQFLVYPHVVYWRATRAKDPKKAELTNMLIDPALFGLWMAALRFPLLITFLLFITALVNNAVNSGFKGLVQCQAAIACGILISVAVFGWQVSPETGWLTAWLSMIIGSLYLIVIGLLAFGANQRLRKTRLKLSESNATLALTLDNLQITQAQLEHANTDFRRLLDNSGEGFLTFGPDLLIDTQYSLACETMLGRSPAGCHAAELFFHDDPAKADLFATIIDSVLNELDADTRESMLSLLPTEITQGDVILKTEYKALDKQKFMVVLTDITAERHMATLLSHEKRRLELIVMAVSDSRNFFETINAFREFLKTGLPRLLQSGQAPQLLVKDLYREIHTYKGLLSQFSFPSAPKTLHEIETQLSNLLSLGDALTTSQLAQLVSQQVLVKPFEADLAVLSDALGEDFLLQGDSIVLSDAQARQLEKLAIRLLRGETVDTSVAEIRNLLHEIGTLRKVSFKDVLLGFDGVLKQAAQRMEKEVAPIEVNGGDDVWIDPNDYRPFLHSLVHVFRNAVAHGLETPEGRWEAQKDERGKITCSVAAIDNILHLTIADDGAGIRLDTLRQRAVGHGIYAADKVSQIPDDTIAQLIFMDNISTQHEVNDLAGRGIGLAAVLTETKNSGGEVTVKTVAGKGTQFLFTLPMHQESPGQDDA
jgi:signal transduction histidine kinase